MEVINPNYLNYYEQTQANTKEIERLKNIIKQGNIESIENIGTSQGDGFTITHIKVTLLDGREEYFDITAETPGSNPNLLINGDFRVNQRGKEVYSFENDTQPYVRHYTLDRWRFVPQVRNSLSTVTKNKDSISIYFANTYDNISQFIENFEHLSNKIVTTSINIKNITGGLFALRIMVDGNQVGYKNITNTGISHFTVTLPNITSSLQVSLVSNSNLPQTVEVEYIKLEIGNALTPFSPIPYAEELSMCQRYYQNIRLHTSSCPNSTTTMYVLVNLPVTLRTSPTINITETPSIRGNNTSITPTSILVNKIVDNGILLLANATGLTANIAYTLINGEGSLDAEIY